MTHKQTRTPSSQLQKRKGVKARDGLEGLLFPRDQLLTAVSLNHQTALIAKANAGAFPRTGQTCLCTRDVGGGGRGGALPSSSSASSSRRDPPLRPPPTQARPVLLPAPSSPSPSSFFISQITSPISSPARKGGSGRRARG